MLDYSQVIYQCMTNWYRKGIFKSFAYLLSETEKIGHQIPKIYFGANDSHG